MNHQNMNPLFDAIYHGCGLLILIVGTIILAQSPKTKNHWIFFLYTIGVLGWMQSLYWGYFFADSGQHFIGLVLIRLAYSFSVLTMLFMTLFFYYFPRVTVSIPKLLGGSFVFCSLVLSVVSATSLVHESMVFEGGVYGSDKLGPLYGLYLVYILVNLLLAFYLGFQKLIYARGIEREKIFFATFGYFVFATLAILTNVILPIFGLFVLQREVPILTIFFFVPAFYAIQRYRFFNLSYVALNALRQLILLSAFFLALVLATWLIGWMDPSFSGQIQGLLGSAVGIFVYIYFRSRLPELVSQGFREYREGLARLGSAVYHCNSIGQLQKTLKIAFLVEQDWEDVSLFVIRKKPVATKGFPYYLEDGFTRWLKDHPRDVLVKDEIPYLKTGDGVKTALSGAMEKLGSDLCIPLGLEGEISGFLALRRNGQVSTYSREQVGELQKLKGHLEIALMNILLTTNLQEENSVMKRVIQQKTRQLRERYLRIKTLSEQQSDFIAVTAHELRTPLTIASFQVKELLEGGMGSVEARKGLEVVETSVGNLQELTQKLFETQRFDLDKVVPKRSKVELREFMRGVYGEFGSIMEEKGIHLSFRDILDRPVWVIADPALLRQLMHNMVNNASKFTPKGGRVELCIERAKGGVRIGVADSGRGVPETLRESVFDKFRSKGPNSGIGLGLYICKKIVQLHGGRISVGQSEWGGALFSVFLKQ